MIRIITNVKPLTVDINAGMETAEIQPGFT
jgi:hypothetical protein